MAIACSVDPMTGWEKLDSLLALLEWQTAKEAIRIHANLSQDALHIYAALLIFIAACLVFRWKPREWKPWLLVFAVQCANEFFDMRNSIADDGVIYIWGNLKDMLNTMIAPTLLMLTARYSQMFGSEVSVEDNSSGDEPEV